MFRCRAAFSQLGPTSTPGVVPTHPKPAARGVAANERYRPPEPTGVVEWPYIPRGRYRANLFAKLATAHGYAYPWLVGWRLVAFTAGPTPSPVPPSYLMEASALYLPHYMHALVRASKKCLWWDTHSPSRNRLAVPATATFRKNRPRGCFGDDGQRGDTFRSFRFGSGKCLSINGPATPQPPRHQAPIGPAAGLRAAS